MASEIELSKFLLVANKITSPEDEEFIKSALPEVKNSMFIPFSNEIRKADRDGVSIVDVLTPELKSNFDAILKQIDQER